MDPLTIRPHKIEAPNRNTYDLRRNEDSEEMDENEVPQKKEPGFFSEVFKFAFLAFIIVVPFRLFIAQPFIVSGASMSPTFKTGEYLIVDQITYQFEEPERGDVVIFRFPNDPSKFFVKRIIGLPREVVQLANGVTTIIDPDTQNELVLDEKYLVTDKTDDHLTITLSSDEFFVMGDNRGASSDSRVWGPVPRDNIVGRALIRLLPIETISLFPGAYMYSNSSTATHNDATAIAQ